MYPLRLKEVVGFSFTFAVDETQLYVASIGPNELASRGLY
tara:strand:- start:568 stop:687 length:120 start_codon:yes stop_codon:yes gene_type:complete